MKIGKLTTPFGAKTEQEKFHPGIDLAAKRGTPLPAFKGGKVVQIITGKPHGTNDFGNSIMIKDKKGLTHRYSHLHDVLVKPGQTVGDGQKIGSIGDSGATYSPSGSDSSNLDYRIVDAFGKFINPMAS
jgi:murein DD-endopeptidase MepM/ murein hydrolase activator NlpD